MLFLKACSEDIVENMNKKNHESYIIFHHLKYAKIVIHTGGLTSARPIKPAQFHSSSFFPSIFSHHECLQPPKIPRIHAL